ncbi:SUKH-4 family immunity protein [Streptomyces sp. NBC_01280]|uniref:nucleic acid/nucleotide deaminase domain-containing protein n=1 Tax=Streptomyces sp. NBC_01280 TaxID=2903810 RepID=UPI002E2F739C|nr:nucleic acid/nucleotide deaminase domain-containing protein [Streptomyces sp. NBC_01280]
MPDQTPNSAADHFGRDGMRRLSLSNLGATVQEDVRAVLEQVGVPLVVAPYFAAAGETDGLTLGLYAGHHGLRCDESQAHWVRLGVDGLAHMAVSADGVVHAVFLDQVEPGMFVNSDVSAFSQCLAALDRRLGVIAASTDLSGGAAAFRELNAELRLIDSGAFEGRENWWPRVLDDVRHALNIAFSAAIEHVDASGQKHIVTDATGPGKLHPEELIWQQLQDAGVEGQQVTRVYCELEACMMPGHYCAAWMAREFPNAQFTHSFDYGDTAESREEGLKELIRFAAERARQ